LTIYSYSVKLDLKDSEVVHHPIENGIETFEKCSILFKFKEGENFNHPDEIGTGIHTLSILRIKI